MMVFVKIELKLSSPGNEFNDKIQQSNVQSRGIFGGWFQNVTSPDFSLIH